MTLNIILRSITLVQLIVWRVYWVLTTKKAAVNKPKTDSTKRTLESMMFVLYGTYVVINLIGFILFPFNNLLAQLFGFMLVVLGFVQAITARKTLADNWTESFEYQIKKNHELITQGIYKYVRHPIYGALIMMVTGALMVSESYTFIAGLVIVFIVAEIFAQREEKILTKHFGKKYLEYMKTAKKFIPFLY